MRNLAVIPARGGSKRIPRKNIKFFKNKPLIVWSIEAAKKSKCFDKIIVSTDDQQIAEIAKDHGADVPFLRPKELADDYTIDWLFINQKKVFKNVCCIYATAPLIQIEDLKKSLTMLESSQEDIYVFVATSYPFPIHRSISIDEKGYSSMFYPDKFQVRSQDLKEAFHDAGQFYWAKSQSWNNIENIFQGSKPLVIPRWRVQDIDTDEDWIRAEKLFDLL